LALLLLMSELSLLKVGGGDYRHPPKRSHVLWIHLSKRYTHARWSHGTISPVLRYQRLARVLLLLQHVQPLLLELLLQLRVVGGIWHYG
jgi:hypothetical protein